MLEKSTMESIFFTWNIHKKHIERKEKRSKYSFHQHKKANGKILRILRDLKRKLCINVALKLLTCMLDQWQELLVIAQQPYIPSKILR